MRHRLSKLVFLAAALLAATPAKAARIHSETKYDDLQSLFSGRGGIYWTLIIFLPVIATFFLVLSGYRYIVSQGNPDLVEKAKRSLLYAVFGVLVAYSSVAIIALLGQTLSFDTGLG